MIYVSIAVIVLFFVCWWFVSECLFSPHVYVKHIHEPWARVCPMPPPPLHKLRGQPPPGEFVRAIHKQYTGALEAIPANERPALSYRRKIHPDQVAGDDTQRLRTLRQAALMYKTLATK